MSALIDLTGREFGRLRVLYRVENTPDGRVQYYCLCACGTSCKVRGGQLSGERTHSCGCWTRDVNREKSTRHGMRHRPEYTVWYGMRQRCNNSKNKAFSHYGGRGIRVCNAWMYSFVSFFADLGPRPSNTYLIERRDNNGNYSCGKCEECIANNWPANCYWATKIEQANNTRQNVLITIDKITQTLTQWTRFFGVVSMKTAHDRIKYGWDPVRAVQTPVIIEKRHPRKFLSH